MSFLNKKPAIIKRKEAKDLLRNLKGWKLSEDSKEIYVEYLMKDFMAAIRLIGAVAKISEKADHHPDIHLSSYRKLKILLTTHDVKGLTGNDFALASKIVLLPKALKEN